MTGDLEPRLARSHQELEAARLLADRGFHAQGVSRAYYAAFYAASEALLALGESRPKHSGVIAAFASLVVKAEGVEEEIGRALRSLFDQRSVADYGDDSLQRAMQRLRWSKHRRSSPRSNAGARTSAIDSVLGG